MDWFQDIRGDEAFIFVPAALVLSAAFTWMAIHYARRNRLIDLPGQRRSHNVPTPRGGGIGIVLAVVAVLFAIGVVAPPFPLRLVVAVVVVAAIGWIDDHRPLPAWSRFLVHCCAVGIWLAPLFVAVWAAPTAPALDTSPMETLGIALLIAFLSVWSINLHNFMDGIDGLLATQAIFVLTVLAVLCLREPASPHALEIGTWAAAIAGFLPFNFPRARVFMGDVGSGVVGLLVAAAALWQLSMPEVAAASGFVAVSAFAVDAGCTLLSRMLRGRRWYNAHCEHLYQWLVRSGLSHARVVTLYAAWNVFVALPVLWWMNRVPPMSPDSLHEMPSGYGWAVVVYALGIVMWVLGKRTCLRRVRMGGAHAPT
ncbi:MAG TPA: glycosyltransferase family 4 protein [Rudaea sp.]|nr:glycosyltransferase family 4 protein [Rudaea sp.]